MSTPDAPGPAASGRSPLTDGARTGLTLLVLAVLLVGGFLWGVREVTAPFGGSPFASDATKTADASDCRMVEVKAGNQITPPDLVVSVLNAGSREGRAGEVLQQLGDAGFAPGRVGNAPAGTSVSTAEIWTTTPRQAATRLVRSALGPGVEVVRREVDLPGIVVVIGDGFDAPTAPRESVTSVQASTICSPPESES